MKFSDLIIYTDVDGTTATHINYVATISDANLLAIEEFVNEGGLFGVASGRNHPSIDQIFQHKNINLPYIEANGASVWDKEKQDYLSIHYINREFKKKIYEFVKNNKKLMLTAMRTESKKVVFQDERDEWILDYPRKMMSYEEFIETDLLKCAILSNKPGIDQAMEEMKEVNFLRNITSSRSADIYLEFFNSKASKGEGIKAVLQSREDLKNRKLVCIGDFYNDISMLEIADIAICPANAVAEVQEICDYISVSNDKDTLVDVMRYLRGIHE
jgi:Cof subfamily protein (haloacid dehalogenase superfamily)